MGKKMQRLDNTSQFLVRFVAYCLINPKSKYKEVLFRIFRPVLRGSYAKFVFKIAVKIPDGVEAYSIRNFIDVVLTVFQ